MTSSSPKNLFFAYTKPENFSGQTAASELLIELYSKESIKCIPLILYPLENGHRSWIKACSKAVYKQFTIISDLRKLLFNRGGILHLNLGQSIWSFVRIGVWYFPIKVLKGNQPTVISLHGSLFMIWKENSFVMRSFKIMLKSCNIVTVLGERQKTRLVELGIKPQKIRVVPNTCTLNLVNDSFIYNKHSSCSSVNLLYLSLLIGSKGYNTYLDSLEALSKMQLPLKVNAILCGPITFQANSESFRTETGKIEWIDSRIKSINNNSDNFKVDWIHGASGDMKVRLFQEAHIFVLPTRFPVEAQPIVLIEALASGCSIITSKAGEIPYTLNDETAILLDEPNETNLTKELLSLIINSEKRITMCRAGLRLVEGPLSVETHKKKWDEIFLELLT